VERRRHSVYFLYLAWRLWKSVVTLTVTGNTISSRVVWRQIVSVYRRHRMSLTGSRWDIRWVSGRGKTPTFCVFPVFSVAVVEKCCDACGHCKTISGRFVWRHRVPVLQWHRLPSIWKSMGHTVGERSWEDADFLCISCI
jgi:hypothetical protein